MGTLDYIITKGITHPFQAEIITFPPEKAAGYEKTYMILFELFVLWMEFIQFTTVCCFHRLFLVHPFGIVGFMELLNIYDEEI